MEEQSPTQEIQYRVGSFATGFSIVIALLFDCLQFILNFIPVMGQVVSWFITFFAFSIFTVFFALLGVNYFSGKKASAKIISFLSSAVIELVPIVNALPAMTLGIIGILVAVRYEDKAMATANRVKNNARTSAPRFSGPTKIQSLRARESGQEQSSDTGGGNAS